MNEESVDQSVAFGGEAVVIQARGKKSSRLAREMFCDSRSCDFKSQRQPIRLADLPDGRLTLTYFDAASRNSSCQKTGSLGTIALSLWRAVQYLLCQSCDQGLMLHAGAVVFRDTMFIFPGPSGVGKTTLTATLVARGGIYLSDELVFVDKRSQLSSGLTRPLNIKFHGLAAIQSFLVDNWEKHIVKTSVGYFVPHRMFHEENWVYPRPERKISSIIFIRKFSPGPFRLRPMSNAEATAMLMSCLINARNLEESGLLLCKALASVVSKFSLECDNEETVPVAINRLIATIFCGDD